MTLLHLSVIVLKTCPSLLSTCMCKSLQSTDTSQHTNDITGRTHVLRTVKNAVIQKCN